MLQFPNIKNSLHTVKINQRHITSTLLLSFADTISILINQIIFTFITLVSNSSLLAGSCRFIISLFFLLRGHYKEIVNLQYFLIHIYFLIFSPIKSRCALHANNCRMHDWYINIHLGFVLEKFGSFNGHFTI